MFVVNLTNYPSQLAWALKEYFTLPHLFRSDSARTFRTPLGLRSDSARTFRNFFWQRFLPIFIIFLAQSERIPSKVRAESEEVLGLGHRIV